MYNFEIRSAMTLRFSYVILKNAMLFVATAHARVAVMLSFRQKRVKFAMFSCYFLHINRQSIQVLCPVFSREVFFEGVEGSNKFGLKKHS